jgi:hypothetical protein
MIRRSRVYAHDLWLSKSRIGTPNKITAKGFPRLLQPDASSVAFQAPSLCDDARTHLPSGVRTPIQLSRTCW